MKLQSKISKINLILPKKIKIWYFVLVFFLFLALIFQLVGIGSLVPLSESFLDKNSKIDLLIQLRGNFKKAKKQLKWSPKHDINYLINEMLEIT